MRDRRGKERGEVGKGPSPTCFLPARAAPKPQCPAGASVSGTNHKSCGEVSAARWGRCAGGGEMSLEGKNQSPADRSLAKGRRRLLQG